MDTLPALTSARILDDSMTILQAHIPLQAAGYRCQAADLWRVLLAATAQHRSIEATCADLDGAPHPNTIRFTLRRFQTFLLAAITAIYGQTTQLILAPYQFRSLARSEL